MQSKDQRLCINCHGLIAEKAITANAIYQMDLTGIGDLADQFAMVEIRHCPECGKRMEIHMQPNDGASLEYQCSCGRHYQFRA